MIQIADRQIELLPLPADAALPPGQVDTYRLLLTLQPGCYSTQQIVQLSNLRSSLPFWSRLHHLEARGLIRLSDPALVKA